MPSQQQIKAPRMFNPPYSKARPAWLARIKVSNSILNVEKVVNPPKIPVTMNSFITGDNSMRDWKYIIRIPMAKEPMTFTRIVP